MVAATIIPMMYIYVIFMHGAVIVDQVRNGDWRRRPAEPRPPVPAARFRLGRVRVALLREQDRPSPTGAALLRPQVGRHRVTE